MSKYAGQWIAIYNQSIIASSKDFIEAINKAKEKTKNPLMVKIQKKEYNYYNYAKNDILHCLKAVVSKDAAFSSTQSCFSQGFLQQQKGLRKESNTNP